MSDALLELDDLEVAYGAGQASVLRGVSLALAAGEVLALVGESGCGKSTMALALLGLLPAGAHVARGSLRVGGTAVELRGDGPAAVRGARIGVVFQDSMASLNPVLSVGTQIGESLAVHRGLRGAAARARAVELLEEVGVTDAPARLGQFPHQLSGGLRQRVAIAIALAADPGVLLADEPTTALDVTVQAQILDLLLRERERRGMGLLLITHDLGVVARVADRVCVMYAGRIVESGPVELLGAPRHPYTAGLLRSVPRVDGRPPARLPSIAGAPPAPDERPPGCSFAPRCARADDRCRTQAPVAAAAAHAVECWHPEDARG